MCDQVETKDVRCYVQTNGIIRRNSDGRLIGRLVDDFKYDDLTDEQLHPLFKKELAELINRHSVENCANMPDFMMAQMISEMLLPIGDAIKKNVEWHNNEVKEEDI